MELNFEFNGYKIIANPYVEDKKLINENLLKRLYAKITGKKDLQKYEEIAYVLYDKKVILVSYKTFHKLTKSISQLQNLTQKLEEK